MKTPDEIKKGLVLCYKDIDCTECPYADECFEDDKPYALVLDDALAYIQQLEAELADTKKAVGMVNGLCDICKHQNAHEAECEANDFLCYNCPVDCACKECYSDAGHYEWRGVQKEE